MSISFSGVGSGLPISDWIEALVNAKTEALEPMQEKYKTLNTTKSTLNSVKTTYSSLASKVESFTDSKFGTSFDVFSQKNVKSSSEDAITATATNSTPVQNLKISVDKLATATQAKSTNNPAHLIDENTNISNLANASVTAGTMSFYVNDSKYTIDVASTDSLGDIATKMENATKETEDGAAKITATIEDGKFKLTPNNAETISIGSNADTSNLASALSLKATGTGSVESATTIPAVNTKKALTNADSGFYSYDGNGEKVASITEGTFKIGNAEFTVGANTTMDGLIAKINSTSEANATAYYDYTDNKLIITSNEEGAFYVNIESGTSNFTDVMGLTSGGNMLTSAQILGENSEVTINGTSVQAYSNTLTSETTGIAGLTLNLNKVTTDDVTINVTKDTDSIVDSIKDLITSVNSVISTTDKVTDSEGDLAYESRLISIRNSIRNGFMSQQNTNGSYATLNSIGISTGAVGMSVDADTSQFQIDEEKLRKAIENDPEAVKALFVGDSTTTGVLNSLDNTLDRALDNDSGYFASKSTTITSLMEDISDTLTKKTNQIATYQTQLTTKFNKMDEVISNLNSQYSYMKSVLGLA